MPVALIEQGEQAKLTAEAYNELLENDDFKNVIFSNTSNIDSVKTRKKIADKILFGHE